MGFVQGLYTWLGVNTPFDPQARYVTSYILSPTLLLAWRSLISVYTLVTIILAYVFGGPEEFSFLTILSYWGIWGYFTISSIHTASYILSYKRWERATQNDQTSSAKQAEAGQISADQSNQIAKAQSWLSKSFPRPLQFFHALLVSTISTYPLLVTIVFWTILSGGAFYDTRSTWENLSVHAFNLMFTMSDIIIFSRNPMLPWSHCFFTVLLLAMYVGVAYITYAAQGFYPYDFLNQGEHGTGTVSGYIVAIGVGTVISFMIAQFIIFLREYVWSKIQKSGGWG
ncbi:uncharacterized protein FA14DRAFT_160184, partial [Meira miltonrushii]